MATTPLDQPWPEPLVPPVVVTEFEDRIRKALGQVPAVIPYVATVPWTWELVYAKWLWRPEFAPERWADLAHFTVAQENCCRVCYGAQRAVMRVLGYSESWIDRLERDIQLAELSQPEQAIVAYSRQLARANPRPGGVERRRLEAAGLSSLQIAEITTIVAAESFANRLTTFLAAPPESGLERVSKAWWGAPLRLWIRRALHRSPKLEPPPARSLGGLFGVALREIQSLVWAPILRCTLDDMLADERLPARTKLLLFAVVACALDCEASTREATEALAAAGFSETQTKEVLTHLDSDELEPAERALVSFARCTVRFDPADIQRRVGELVSSLGPDVTREAVAVTALANAIVRLGALSS